MAKVIIPQTPDELEAMLLDRSVMDTLQKEGQFPEFITAYARTVMNKDVGIKQQIHDEVQRVTTQWLKDNGGRDVGLNMRPDDGFGPSGAFRGNSSLNKMALNCETAPGYALNKSFKNASQYFRTVWHEADERRVPGVGALRDKIAQVQNSFGSTIPADGGFLIPEVLRSQLLAVALESAIMRPGATVIPMETLRVALPMIDSTSNVSSVFGGIVMYWTEESAGLTDTSARFGRVVLDAKKLTGLANVPNELPADASAFGAFIDTQFPKALAWYEDIAFMMGSGAGEPLGWVNSPAAVIQTAETGQGASTIVWENLVKMYSRMLPSSLASAVWVASIDTFPQLATMALSVGTGGGPVWLGGPSTPGSATPPVTILGRPVMFTEKTPALGTTGDISFVDRSYYLIGDRQAMSAMSSPHYRFGNDQTSYRIIERVDGRPWLQSAITPHNNSSNTLSAFVQLSSTRT